PRRPPGLHLGPPRGALRPGHRGAQRGRRGRPGVRTHRGRERRRGGDGSAGDAGPGPAGRTGRMTVRLLVVGGGIAGLAAAWEAATGGASGGPVEVTVLEAGDRFGGKIRTSDLELPDGSR